MFTSDTIFPFLSKNSLSWTFISAFCRYSIPSACSTFLKRFSEIINETKPTLLVFKLFASQLNAFTRHGVMLLWVSATPINTPFDSSTCFLTLLTFSVPSPSCLNRWSSRDEISAHWMLKPGWLMLAIAFRRVDIGLV